MASVVYAPSAFDDLNRLITFLAERDTVEGLKTARLITEAVALLERHPLMGHPVEQGFRELVISCGRTGYLALYEYRPAEDLVLILALRHQREAGYVDPSEI